MTVVVWQQLLKVRVPIAPPRWRGEGAFGLTFDFELVHVSVVVPAVSSRSAEVPEARVA